jgi:hypothetical protein
MLALWGSADARRRGLELKVDSRVTIEVDGWEAVDEARGSQSATAAGSWNRREIKSLIYFRSFTG